MWRDVKSLLDIEGGLPSAGTYSFFRHSFLCYIGQNENMEKKRTVLGPGKKLFRHVSKKYSTVLETVRISILIVSTFFIVFLTKN